MKKMLFLFIIFLGCQTSKNVIAIDPKIQVNLQVLEGDTSLTIHGCKPYLIQLGIKNNSDSTYRIPNYVLTHVKIETANRKEDWAVYDWLESEDVILQGKNLPVVFNNKEMYAYDFQTMDSLKIAPRDSIRMKYMIYSICNVINHKARVYFQEKVMPTNKYAQSNYVYLQKK